MRTPSLAWSCMSRRCNPASGQWLEALKQGLQCCRLYEYEVPPTEKEFRVAYERQQGAPLKEGSMWGKAYEYLCIVARFGGFAAVNEAKYAPLVMQVCYLTHHQLAQTPPPLVRLWAEARRQVEPEKDPKGTTSRLKSAYQVDLLSFEQHLRKDAPSRPVPIRNLKKRMLAAEADPSSPAGGASAEVSDHKDWRCMTPA